jgi:hypothetical protein
MAAISTMASPKLNRRDGLSRMARPWKVWLLDHPLRSAAGPSPEWHVSTIIHTIRQSCYRTRRSKRSTVPELPFWRPSMISTLTFR